MQNQNQDTQSQEPSEGGLVKDVFDTPDVKPTARNRKKRVKEEKLRLHIYISEKTLERIDQKAEELGLPRSGCVQMLIHFALKNVKMKDFMSKL